MGGYDEHADYRRNVCLVDTIQRDGVYFQPIAQVAMGDSAWTVVMNSKFDRINAMIEDISNQLTVRKHITSLLVLLLYSI